MKNLAILIGNLGADPEIRHTQTGTQVATFNVATTERFKGKDGQMQDATEWHRIVAWGRLAEICGEYLHKGSRIYLEGKIQTRNYDKDGTKVYVTEIVAREMKMLSPKGGESTGPSKQQDSGWPEEPSGGYGGGTGEDVPF